MSYAQEAAAQAETRTPQEQPSVDKEIVVTGTLIRGVAPAGANVLGTTAEDIQSSGATTIAQVLQNIPQLGSFNSLQQPLANSPEVAVNRPNLRGLPNVNTGAGSTTLVLMSGHRLVGMGITSNSPDPDVIPPGVLERLEIVPDGGSAVYGSDAVAGVMNFVTIKRFNGVKVDGSYGFADNYYSWDANVTAGKDWGSGSFFASYSYVKTDELLGKDRDYIRQYPSSNGYTELRCSPGNIEALAGVYSAAGSVVGAGGGAVNQCDNSDYATVYPKSERHSLFAGLTQQLSDKLSVDLTGYYTNRKTHIQNGPFRASEIIVPDFFAPVAGALGIPAITSPFSPFVFGGFVGGQPVFLPGSPNSVDLVQQADFTVGDNKANVSDIELDTWGVTSTFSYDLDSNFRLRVMGNYGESTTTGISTGLNEPALQNAIVAGLINPYDVASSDPTALDIVTNFGSYARSRQQMINFRGIIDGSLFQLPGGAAKIAVGAEYIRESFVSDRGQVIPGYEFSGAPAQYIGTTLIAPAQDPVTRFDVARHVTSLFGEFVAPVLGGGEGPSLNLSAAARYDHYSDVGGTFNPKFGATFQPVDWISIRGAWGKSFNAPGLADAENADFNTLYVLTGQSAAFFAPPAALTTANGGPYPAYTGGTIVAIRGNAPGIKPQKATTWTAGIEVEPPIAPGLKLSATYYNISYKNFIGLAPFQDPALLYRDYGNLITLSPTQAQLDAVYASSDVIAIGSGPLYAPGTYALLDARKRNLGDFKLDGIDFAVNYNLDTSFGAVFLNVGGTYELHRKLSSTQGGDFVDVLSDNTNRLRSRSTLGGKVGPVTGQITWNYSQGYDLDPAQGFVLQDHVKSFNTFDLFFKFDVPGGGLASDLAITLNVNNVFNQDPPVYRGGVSIGGQQGVANGLTIGRFVKLGVSKKF